MKSLIEVLKSRRDYGSPKYIVTAPPRHVPVYLYCDLPIITLMKLKLHGVVVVKYDNSREPPRKR